MKTGSFGIHILLKKICASIFSSPLGNIDLMIFQIFFFLGRKFHRPQLFGKKEKDVYAS